MFLEFGWCTLWHFWVFKSSRQSEAKGATLGAAWCWAWAPGMCLQGYLITECMGKVLHDLGECPSLPHSLMALFYTVSKNYRDNLSYMGESWKFSRMLSESWMSSLTLWSLWSSWCGYPHKALQCLIVIRPAHPPVYWMGQLFAQAPECGPRRHTGVHSWHSV